MNDELSSQTNRDQLVDFWFRRQAAPRFQREFRVMGRAVQLLSNEEAVFTAADEAIPLYSSAPPTSHPSLVIQFVVQSAAVAPGPVPDDLMQHITYTGDADWLMLHLSRWGQAHVDLEAGRAVAVLSPELAERPDLISQCLLHTILLNFIIASGLGLLHASCLVQAEKVLLLLAPHNSGKSTTALKLALSGYTLVTDSMVFVDASVERVQLSGFPVGTIKLRPDVLAHFPAVRPLLRPEVVRQETKYRLDLRQVEGAQVCPTAVTPDESALCLLSRHDRPETIVRPADRAAVWPAIMRNSLYYDTGTVWEGNLRQLRPLVAQAKAYHLTLGTDEAQMLSAIRDL